jgi:hypothetical protein
MKRREFITLAAAGAAIAPAFNAAAADSPDAPAREFYELRLYHLRRGPMQQRFDDFYRNAAIPAMNRAGISPVGVFSVLLGPDSPTMYALLTHQSLESFATANERVHSDPEYQKAGAEFTNAPATDPSYVRVESSLMVAFSGFPKLQVPAQTAAAKPRIFELRTYESPSYKAGSRKIEMFNTAEIPLFHRNGLHPVFFGQSIVGARLPNLTYMLVHDDMAAREQAWAAFGSDPDWKKLRSTPGSMDAEIVSSISNLLLRPTAYSQI